MRKTFRDAPPLTLVNSGEKTVWYPRRMDIPPLAESECSAGPGETYKVGITCDKCAGQCEVGKQCPGRIFKTDKQMRAEGWSPATSRDALAVYATTLAILVVVFSVWAYWTWWA